MAVRSQVIEGKNVVKMTMDKTSARIQNGENTIKKDKYKQELDKGMPCLRRCLIL